MAGRLELVGERLGADLHHRTEPSERWSLAVTGNLNLPHPTRRARARESPGQVHDLELTGDALASTQISAQRSWSAHTGFWEPTQFLPRVVVNLAGDPVAVPRLAGHAFVGRSRTQAETAASGVTLASARTGQPPACGLKRPLQPRSACLDVNSSPSAQSSSEHPLPSGSASLNRGSRRVKRAAGLPITTTSQCPTTSPPQVHGGGMKRRLVRSDDGR